MSQCQIWSGSSDQPVVSGTDTIGSAVVGEEEIEKEKGQYVLW